MWTVGETARFAHVTVRTLHHYDAIGLLRPAKLSQAGYRLYGQAELERLYLIGLYREVGLPLEAIRRLLDDPGFDRVAALRTHRERLRAQLHDTRERLAALDHLIEGGREMSAEEMFEGMRPEWEEEARERWGDTEAWRVSQERARSYDAEAWARMREEVEAIEAELARCLRAGEPPNGEAAMDAAERARLHIDRWFYPCSKAMHVSLGEMYTADPRFTRHYDDRAEGLAAYVAAAIAANAAR